MRKQYRAHGVINCGVNLQVGPILAGVRKGTNPLVCLEWNGRIGNKVARVKVGPVEGDRGRKVEQGLSPVISCVKGAMRRGGSLATGNSNWGGRLTL